MADTATELAFAFTYLDSKKYNTLKDSKELLEKWSMHNQLMIQTFSFNHQFKPYHKDKFVLDFLRDPNVLANLQIVSESGKVSTLGTPASEVAVTRVPCSILSMTFFDRLYGDVVRSSGHIQKCFDDYHDNIQISDELRKMLLIDDSDHYCLYSDEERDEFLFRMFLHLCIGGRICQFEDVIDPYLTTTKAMYKELISVEKNPETKKIGITSIVFKVSASNSGSTYYPCEQEHIQNFAYLIVDPLKRHVTVVYHRFGGMGFF